MYCIVDGVSLWEIVGKFNLKVISAGNLNVDKDASIQVYAGVFHGTEEICQVSSTHYIHIDHTHFRLVTQDRYK